MGLFTKKIGTVFLKETSDASIFIDKLQMLREKAQGEMKKEIETQIKLATYGEVGENNVAFELKNSGMDMYVLRDIYLEIGDLSAQIDYIVITRKHIYVLECKNLIGNIEIDNGGNFVRTYELSGKRIRERIYSPITQNQRHLQILKEVGRSSKGNFLAKLLFEKSFEENYKSVVVLANPKTYLNAKFAKKEIKEQVIHADQLITYIKNMELSKDNSMTSADMLNLAQFYLENNRSNKCDYANKYEELLRAVETDESKDNRLENSAGEQAESTFKENAIKEEKTKEVIISASREEATKHLKAFRREQSQKENVPSYFIFNNTQMNDLLDKNPKSKEELLKVSGFGSVKVEKYGERILEILRDY
ncbi:MAG: NERD domain-containing protein [Bacteroidales bacterium]|nr:NERD domain-containing protein [Clostridium sp.]MCM1204015.1 NERD domain-containing protein [Bacteroidales bacterium]